MIGFALHNATEGFGIVAPLAGDVDARRRTPAVRRWGFLLALGAHRRRPDVRRHRGRPRLHQRAGQRRLPDPGRRLDPLRRRASCSASPREANRMDLLAYGLLIGLLAGFLTDAIVTAAGV